MKEELKWIENKAIIIREDMIPKFIKGRPVYPRAYFEDDVKALIRKVKGEARRELLKELYESACNCTSIEKFCTILEKRNMELKVK